MHLEEEKAGYQTLGPKGGAFQGENVGFQCGRGISKMNTGGRESRKLKMSKVKK